MGIDNIKQSRKNWDLFCGSVGYVLISAIVLIIQYRKMELYSEMLAGKAFGYGASYVLIRTGRLVI